MLDVSEARVRDVMIPRLQIEIIDASEPLESILETMLESSHSRYPVMQDKEIVGILLAKDVLRAVVKGELNNKEDLQKIYRDAIFIPESKRLNVLLREFKSSRNHLALVVDEYAELAGLVTIEDILEIIVGEIEDEHDEEEELLKEVAAGHWRANARLPLADLQEALGGSLPDIENIEDIDTLGGMVFALAGRVPERGERISADMPDGGQLAFTIRDGDARRIKTLDVRLSGRAA